MFQTLHAIIDLMIGNRGESSSVSLLLVLNFLERAVLDHPEPRQGPVLFEAPIPGAQIVSMGRQISPEAGVRYLVDELVACTTSSRLTAATSSWNPVLFGNYACILEYARTRATGVAVDYTRSTTQVLLFLLKNATESRSSTRQRAQLTASTQRVRHYFLRGAVQSTASSYLSKQRISSTRERLHSYQYHGGRCDFFGRGSQDALDLAKGRKSRMSTVMWNRHDGTSRSPLYVPELLGFPRRPITGRRRASPRDARAAIFIVLVL